MSTQKEPSPEALANVTEQNIETRSQLLPEEKEMAGERHGGDGRPRSSWPSRRSAPSTPTRTTPRAATVSRRTRRTCPERCRRRPRRPRARGPAALVGPRQLGHVNHARALSLLEDARLALAATAPGVAAGRLPDIILARLEVDYLRQLYYRVGEVLTVRSWVARIGTKSVTVRQELLQDGEVAIRADGVVCDVRRPHRPQPRAHRRRARVLDGLPGA